MPKHKDKVVSLRGEEVRPSKKAKLMGSDGEEESEDGGVTLKVNEAYARRFEHNKKRAEKHRLEEKYGKTKTFARDEESEEDSEEDVEEDDAGELATEALDAEIFATLNAIRSKDPRVYDKSVTFYQETEDGDAAQANGDKKEKPMTLKDYHTKNLLEGNFGGEDEDAIPVQTYAQEQEATKRRAIKEINAAAGSDEEEEEDDFLVTKSRSVPPKERVKITEEDVENAEKDPDTFLSNFLAARAWVPTGESHWQPLESDDEDEEARAEEYEHAYNLYFEDPSTANEKIVTYARDAVASTTVRREERSGRRRAREAARAKREAERKEREEDLARLRMLKVEEMQNKVKQIRKTAGLTGRDFKLDEWANVLEADWSDDQWDKKMRRRFGDAYYDDEEGNNDSEDEIAKQKKKREAEKPTFDDDIDITDLIPDFDDEENERPAITFSSDGENDAVEGAQEEEGDQQPHRSKSSKKRKQERAGAKSTARRDRRLIENLVDSNLEFEKSMASSSKRPSQFQYRDVSPTNFGMTSQDILMASDAQLNEFAGLKKLATFRDPAKKKKDRKHLSKKARLRQWRMDTFGDEAGPKGGFETPVGEQAGNTIGADEPGAGGVDIREGDGKRKKKRSKKRKGNPVEAV